ncbi:Lar family restriction alleviation protein [Pseudomonas fulva]|uniref:Lar family restriction alleviation protein n=1 Tax=Pseudomonas fulva TaxID=47880 RepID=UPI003850303E
MPTENRSSNTEMVAQLSPCPFCGQQDAFVEQLDSDASVVICQGRIDEHSACLARGPVGVQQHEWEEQPGHDQAVKEWNKRAAAQNHPDPIAWMVGTAFWWTKEEAERDAAETGLPIVGLGPMLDCAEVERLRAELRVQDALLEEAYQRDIGTPLKGKIRVQRVALSASAEPSEPVAEVKP